MFGVRDPIPRGPHPRKCVVYKFLCTGCNAYYVGESSRHLSTRVHEYLVSDKNSHVQTFKKFSTMSHSMF